MLKAYLIQSFNFLLVQTNSF